MAVPLPPQPQPLPPLLLPPSGLGRAVRDREYNFKATKTLVDETPSPGKT
jgi:hypothetical protein